MTVRQLFKPSEVAVEVVMGLGIGMYVSWETAETLWAWPTLASTALWLGVGTHRRWRDLRRATRNTAESS